MWFENIRKVGSRSKVLTIVSNKETVEKFGGVDQDLRHRWMPARLAGGRLRRRTDHSVRGAEEDRTPDLLNAIQALSQLSYSPICESATSHLIPPLAGFSKLESPSTSTGATLEATAPDEGKILSYNERRINKQ